MNETPNKWQQVARENSVIKDSCFWQDVYVFPWQLLLLLYSTQVAQVICGLLS